MEQAVEGNSQAVEALCGRLRPRLSDWARGRLPAFARERFDTDDLVQETLVRSIRNLPNFEIQTSEGFLPYLKTAVLNHIRNEVRRAQRQGNRAELHDEIADRTPGPIEQLLGKETELRYTQALAQLTPEEQDLVVARVELQMTAQEIAVHTGRPSADAARMAARRAILKLASLMKHGD